MSNWSNWIENLRDDAKAAKHGNYSPGTILDLIEEIDGLRTEISRLSDVVKELEERWRDGKSV